jgi:hypothetical protein
MTEIKLNVADIAQLGAKLDNVSLTPDEHAFLGIVLGQAANAFVDVQGYSLFGANLVGQSGYVGAQANVGGTGVTADMGGGSTSVGLFSNLLGGFSPGASISSGDGSTSIIVVGG